MRSRQCIRLDNHCQYHNFTDENLNNQEDVSDRSGNSEPNDKGNTAETPSDAEPVRDGRGGSGGVGGMAPKGRNGQDGGQRRSPGGSGLFTSIFGESNDNEVHQQDQEVLTPGDDAGSFDGRGNGVTGSTGHNVSDTETDSNNSENGRGVSHSFRQRLDEAIGRQQEVENTPVVLMDEANTRDVLPVIALRPAGEDDWPSTQN